MVPSTDVAAHDRGTRTTRPRRAPTTLQRTAAATAGAIALLYALLAADVLTIAGAEDGERAILGVAAALFVVLAGALLRWHRRIVWAITAVIQLGMTWMYVVIAPERDPSYEVWGLTLRGLSLVLLGLVLVAWVRSRRDRGQAPT